MKPIILEAYSTIDEQAHITGVALIPRISRNDNLYTKKELARFHNVKVPLTWEHNGKQIGSVTFHYNPDLETVTYDGMVTDEAIADLVRNRTLYTSIEADPIDMKEICNAPDDCFHMPFGLKPVGLSLTETPGVPETTVKVIENYLRECDIDKELEKKYGTNKWHKWREVGERDKPEQYKDCIDTVDVLTQRCIPEQKGDDCVQKWISKLSDEEPDKSQDQIIAIAFSKCGLSKDESYKFLLNEYIHESFCPDCGKLKKKNK